MTWEIRSLELQAFILLKEAWTRTVAFAGHQLALRITGNECITGNAELTSDWPSQHSSNTPLTPPFTEPTPSEQVRLCSLLQHWTH